MSVHRELDFSFVEEQIRSKDYGILGTIDSKARPHSTSVLYGVSHQDQDFALYVVTGKNYKKTKNLRANPNISFVIPFPHHILRFVPASCVQFQGTVELIPVDDPVAVETFQKNRVLRITIADALNDLENYVMIRITPNRTIFGYGLGLGIREMRDEHVKGSFRCRIPDDRLKTKIKLTN